MVEINLVKTSSDPMIRRDVKQQFCCMQPDVQNGETTDCRGSVSAYTIPFNGTFTLCESHAKELADE